MSGSLQNHSGPGKLLCRHLQADHGSSRNISADRETSARSIPARELEAALCQSPHGPPHSDLADQPASSTSCKFCIRRPDATSSAASCFRSADRRRPKLSYTEVSLCLPVCGLPPKNGSPIWPVAI